MQASEISFSGEPDLLSELLLEGDLVMRTLSSRLCFLPRSRADDDGSGPDDGAAAFDPRCELLAYVPVEPRAPLVSTLTR